MIVRCLDFETTGLPPNAGVCEVGWTDVIVDEDMVSVGQTVAMLCKPGLPIGEAAQKVHGISDAMVADQIPAMKALQLAGEGADVFCAHNAEFEQNFFGGYDRPWLCTYKVALALYPALPDHKNGNIPGHLGINLDERRCAPLHRAGPDTYVTAMNLTAMLLKSAMASGDVIRAANEFIAISKRPRQISRMPFGKHKGTALSDLPADYLQWCVDKLSAADIRDACRREIKRRAA